MHLLPPEMNIQRLVSAAVLSVIALAPLSATTLQRLSVDEMTQQSSAIVRAKVTGCSGVLRGANVWTIYQLQVLETLKGARTSSVQVAVPGGVAGGMRQMVAGAPTLTTGAEYVFFLWQGRSGLIQLIGLSQGLLSVTRDAEGNINLVRPAAKEVMLDQNLKPVTDPGLRLRWNDLRSRVLSKVGTR